jgi:hypothetical protein
VLGEIWGNSDAFHFAYLTVTGYCTVFARVTSGFRTLIPEAKAGMTIRETLSSGSAHTHDDEHGYD